jgi:kinesin family member 5
MLTFFQFHEMFISLLKSSISGTARTSLIVTIGPSARHYSETSSTIMFGQRVSSLDLLLKKYIIF